MSVEDCLIEFKDQINKELKKFFKYKIEQVKSDKKPKELVEMIENLEKFTLNSGKRIRPILFYFGYIIGGGKNKSEAMKISVSIELIHSYFLIHDDIIDCDNFRHGGLSMHYNYEKKAENNFRNIDIKHFGVSMAIIIGDLSASFGYEVLNSSDFENDLKIKALNDLDKIICNTIFGQALDISLSKDNNFNVDMIFEMQKYKTAKYTIEGPLHLGAILAGADEKFLNSLSDYAIPIGIAFQIQDDIIGIFGNKEKTGRLIGSDIKEGKRTLLFSKAIENANDVQKQTLNDIFGNKNISSADIEKVKNIIIETGSLKFSTNKAEELIEYAKKSLKNLEVSEKNREFLTDLTDFVVHRKY
ncbi:MAG: polyprenyl synthetase family protein [Patescibacteria group bacterium]|nr:polyprenyl synthetase family protein [Patescibacteria group bacterium]